MDLTKSFLPDSVMVSGKHYKIHTGHSYWFRFAQILGQDVKLLSEFAHLYVNDIPEDQQAGVDALYGFYYEEKELPRSEGDSGERVLDYEIDSDLIYAAILQCYRIDLYEKQVHWHKVRAMIAGISGTRLNDVMGYRCAAPGKNTEIARLKRIWALPEKMTQEDKAALERFNAQFY
jgi:hypothetical protein